MKNPDTLDALCKVHRIRKWGKDNLPFYESVIANDLVIFLGIEFFSGRSLTVKRLFTSLPYSYTAIRQHYKKLFEDGWVTHSSDPKDLRIKYIHPSQKFTDVINLYVDELENIFHNN